MEQRYVASVKSKDQDYEVHYSIPLCCCTDIDIGFCSFLRDRFFALFGCAGQDLQRALQFACS